MAKAAAATAEVPDGGAGELLEQDARIADRLAVPRGAPPNRPSEILLTGVTGFLGGEIAAALLRTTAARLHCVVRGQHGRPAGERLQRLCRRWDADPARLVLVERDLVGSTLASDKALAHRIDTVVHCAAAVNLFAPYAELRDANVLGARAILELATRGAPKAIHFVSTVGVFLSPRYRGATVFEDGAVEGADGLRNGYAASKWVADTMMSRARARGFAVSTYRPAFVGWHSASGRAGAHDVVALLLLSSLGAGCAPRLDLQINSTPVDHVAETVAQVVGSSSTGPATFHVVNRAAVPFLDLATAAGLRVVALDKWEAAVAAKAPPLARLAALVRRSQTD
ncbi:MAG TPA: SDR family oxidoreductase, partial [Polyangia bacterium]|nr:SDR family oxidoreductase [Polyangia bacterium]